MAFRNDDEKKKEEAALQAQALREKPEDEVVKKLRERAFQGGAEHGEERYWDTQDRVWRSRPTVKMPETSASSQAKALRASPSPSPSPEPDYEKMTDVELNKAAAEKDEKGNVKNQKAAMEKFKRQTAPKR